jgi:nucleotide-binding universal stress UspA family protein
VTFTLSGWQGSCNPAPSTKEQDMEVSRILVGIDFSDESEAAAGYALKIARHTGADVVLVHAGLVPGAELPEHTSEGAREWRRLVEERLSDDRRRLEQLRERLSTQVPEVSHMVIDGFADAALCEAGEQLGADLIVVGTHGRTGLRRFVLGSVAESVVRLYPRNVMVARPGADASGGFRRILVPTDFSVHAEDALRLAMVLAAPGGTIDVFHAWGTPPELAVEWSGPILYEIAKQAQASGEKLLERHRSDAVTVHFEAVHAGAVTGILDRLQAPGYDLVILGSHGRRGLRRLLVGSVAERVVRHAPCSVIVVHHRDA